MRTGTASWRSLRSSGMAHGRTRKSQRIPAGREPANIQSEKDLIQFRLGVGAEQNIWKLGRSIPTTYLDIFHLLVNHQSDVGTAV